VVAAVHYFATPDDHSSLLDYLGEPSVVTLHPWPVVEAPPLVLTRRDALATAQMMVAHRELGPPSVIRPGHPAFSEPSRAGLFNRINWDRLHPDDSQGLVDANASPVLFWRPAKASDIELNVGDIGSQADAMQAISTNYERWVNRVMGWIRRKGTRVWGVNSGQVHPDLDIQLPFVNAVYALPGALSVLTRGLPGR
jgi:hypothetical protein